MSVDSQFWSIRNTAWGSSGVYETMCFAQFDRLGKFGYRKWPWELLQPSENLYTRLWVHSAEKALSTEQVPWGNPAANLESALASPGVLSRPWRYSP